MAMPCLFIEVKMTFQVEHKFIKNFYHFDEAKSTMEIADNLIKEKELKENFIVCANKQTHGRGRKGNEWLSNEGGLWFTLALYNYDFHPSLMIYFGLMLRRTISKLYNINECLIKWPNDVYIGIKKLSGIIANHNPITKYHLIGIGINTNNKIMQNPQGYNAISLCEYLSSDISHKELLEAFLNEIEDNLDCYLNHNLAGYLDEFNNNHYLKEMNIQIDTGNERQTGICKGLNQDGSLILVNSQGEESIVYAGTVRVI